MDIYARTQGIPGYDELVLAVPIGLFYPGHYAFTITQHGPTNSDPWVGGFSVYETCAGDLTGDEQVNIDDIFAVLGLWGDCPDPCPPYCTGDLTEDCTVNIDDVFSILGMWGLCD